MDKINLLLLASILTIFVSLFLAFFLITVKTKHKLSNRLFAVFLILTAIDVSGVLFTLFEKTPSNFGMFRNLMTFLQMPTFYLYVLSVSYSDFKLKRKHLIHIIPFIIANLLFFPRFYSVDLNSKISFLQNSRSMLEIQFNHIFIHVQIIIYIIAVFMILRKTKKLYIENHTGGGLKTYSWLFQFTLALSFFYAIALFKNIFKFSEHPNISEWLKIGLFLFQLFIICWYLFKALNNPDLFRNLDSKLKLVKQIVSKDKRANTLLVDDDKKYHEDLIKLKKYMAEEKPFLNPSLTIQNISDNIEIPIRDLSVLINHKLNQHFYDFVNNYRIEEAKIILEDNTKSKLTILEILYKVGFNSKSSFNTAFKKQTGTTPTNYRNTL
tara:strand:- start:151 stop:1293 length:1143 start_codon:yes stop_codon:yes gene_type:complete